MKMPEPDAPAPEMGPEEYHYRATAVALMNRCNGMQRILTSRVIPRQIDPMMLMLEMQLNTMRAVALLMDEVVALRWGTRAITFTPPEPPAAGNGADAPRLVVP
jgi:hypothetical protein